MNPATDYRLILITAPSLTVARRLAALLLKEKLVACASLVPKIESHYWWQGQLESSTEVLIILKTNSAAVPQIEKLAIANHPYETPEVIALEIKDGNEKYLNWISSSTVPSPSTAQA
ncbi:MAG: divalent-cation tolerance protein CutA [Verrucomicrobiales bacterium]